MGDARLGGGRGVRVSTVMVDEARDSPVTGAAGRFQRARPGAPPPAVRRRDRRRAEGDARRAEAPASMIGAGKVGGWWAICRVRSYPGTSASDDFTRMAARSLHARGSGKFELRLSAIQRALGCVRGWFLLLLKISPPAKKGVF
jgi:hypothetical protein